MNTFFIAGVQRSGTTLLSVMLRKHPDIHLEEQSISFRMITAFKSSYDLLPDHLETDRQDFYSRIIENDFEGRLARLIGEEHTRSYRDLRTLLQKSIEKKLSTTGTTVWGDKAPNLQNYLSDLLLLIPGAKIIHMVRDGRANAGSIARRSYRNLSLSAQQWVDGNTFGLINRDYIGPENYLIVKYEALLDDPDATMREVCRFLSIPFTEAILDPADKEIPEEKRYVKSKIDRSKIDAFRKELSPAQIKKIERIQGPILREFGYELLSDLSPETFKYLNVRQRIWYNQVDNFRQLFRNRKIDMAKRKLVHQKIPLTKRVYAFFRVLTRDLFSQQIYKAIFNKSSCPKKKK